MEGALGCWGALCPTLACLEDEYLHPLVAQKTSNPKSVRPFGARPSLWSEALACPCRTRTRSTLGISGIVQNSKVGQHLAAQGGSIENSNRLFVCLGTSYCARSPMMHVVCKIQLGLVDSVGLSCSQIRTAHTPVPQRARPVSLRPARARTNLAGVTW